MSKQFETMKDLEEFEDHELEYNGGNKNGILLPISENLDADDESDSSDLESESDFTVNSKPTRRASVAMNQYIYNRKAMQQSRRRKTSCIELFSNKNKEPLSNNYRSNVSLPAITRSMSLPESFENYELKKVPQGSRSATERLQLPEIARNRDSELISEKNCNSRRNLSFLPNIVKNGTQNGSIDLHKKNNLEAKKLDIFMKTKFS